MDWLDAGVVPGVDHNLCRAILLMEEIRLTIQYGKKYANIPLFTWFYTSQVVVWDF